MIENILNMEGIVAREDGAKVQAIRDNKQDIAPSKLPLVKEKLLRIHRYLRRVNDDEKNRECLRIIPRVLQRLQEFNDRKGGTGGSSGPHQLFEQVRDTPEEVEDATTNTHHQNEDPQLEIVKLIADNKKLEAANNELICDVDKNEAELSELREEVGRIRDNKSQLEDFTNSLEDSRNSTDRALNILTSLKKKDKTYRERVFALKKELKACKTERDEALVNLDRQTESFENEHAALIDDNTKLKGRLTSFKRKLDDAMADVEDATPYKKR
ncbi:uncharacterized protein Bfra_011512ib [Botrytis fragariae]|uniref:Uncharacterized protein n=1 Tax=Botrytis fragariae TaxID=1964551 RepID=A0A8H6AYE3_9HELO|nr:uncharacterized protein Bfra_011512ib [Botrytis fragariae]KAF5875750.1 hypothetical protein Bfra_011512ib [Botrytis fragariae]